MRSMSGALLAMAGVAIAGGSAAAAEPVDLRFATVGVGSAWYNYGAGMAELIKPGLPEGSNVEVLPIAGGVGNIKLLQGGEAELGISFPMSAAEGCSGTGEFDTAQDKVRGMIGGLDIYYLGFFVTEDSGITSFDEVISGDKPIRLITTRVGGTGEVGVRQVLDLYGSSKEDIASKGGEVKAMERAATAAAIADGQADGWAHVVTKGHPVATQLTSTTDMRMLPLSEEVVQGLSEEHGWVPASIPAGTFEGQNEEIVTVKAASNILTHEGVPEDIVYAATKAIVENADELSQIHAALGDFDPKQAADPTLLGNCPLHPGAERYYEEAGLL